MSTHDRLQHAITKAIGSPPPITELDKLPLTDPAAVRHAVTDLITTCTGSEPTVAVTGTLDRRLLLIQPRPDQSWTIADLFAQPHRTRAWPSWTTQHLRITDPNTWFTMADITPARSQSFAAAARAAGLAVPPGELPAAPIPFGDQ